MADPISSLGTATNIITLVEFTWKLLTNTKNVYQSATGENENNLVLAVVAEDIKNLSDAIDASPGSGKDMQTLVQTSRKIAGELLKALDHLKVKGKKTVWKSLTVALKDVWHRGKIEEFSQRLAQLQAQVASHMQISLLNGISDVSRALGDLEARNNALGLGVRSELRFLKNEILAAVEKVVPDESQNQHHTKRQLNIPEHDNAFDQFFPGSFMIDLHRFSSSMSQLYNRSQSTMLLHRILRSLHYTTIKERQHRIPEAYIETFTWIFKGSSPDQSCQIKFVDFLQGAGNLFWVQGKPGSGKSTLMKFLSSHAESRLHLGQWASGSERKLLLASHFFWYAGTRLQKSQAGLLRSLLYEILRQCPEIAPLVSSLHPEFRMYEEQDWSWAHEDLLCIFSRVFKAYPGIAFCFFIDGLDEYSEDGMTTTNLIETLRRFADHPNVKMCVSSRPWPVFADAFQNKPGLKLEDLTRNDIMHYVNHHFDKSVSFQRLKYTDQIYPALPERIWSQAQGVFLWVYLVVRDLLDGLTHGEQSQSLLNRLNAFPRDLDKFFQHMVDSIEPQYLQQAARTLDIAIGAEQALTMVAYSFIDEVENNARFPLHLGNDGMPDEEFRLREDLMRRRLSGRCKGLLEIMSGKDMSSPYLHLKVDFIHRTVYEFLRNSSSVQSLIELHAKNISSSLLLCRATVAEIKRAPFKEFLEMANIHQFINNLFFFAAKAELDQENREEVVKLLESSRDTFHKSFWNWEKQEGAIQYSEEDIRQSSKTAAPKSDHVRI
ncbi:hypothetical protein MGN70_001913 [Eutypa lata]|nr:hypothetical protein MGN70_001913 [Eutypa lata]